VIAPRWAAALLLLLLAGGSGAAAQEPAGSVLRKRTVAEDLQMFSQVLNQIRVNHPDSIDTHELFMAAIRGLVHAADPHSVVIPAARLAPEKEKALREGKLHPVPIDFAFYGGAPVVVSVAPGSRAARLDILPGDELIAIDGASVEAESALELDVFLAGPKGSSVELTLERRRTDGSLARITRSVQRERVEEATAVPVALMLDDRTGYVRITSFAGDRVADDLNDALDRLEKQGLARLVLDLRDNGGGSVEEAASVAGAFLPKGTVVYRIEGRKEDVARTGKVERSFWKSERRYPIVVLTNAGTASAAELVAGALQDHDRALIVGRRTFGKALVMRTLPLADGSRISLVVGHLVTPCGRIVQRQYRNITRREYYRLAGADRDTVGLPTCTSTGGRTLYGGGGIYPDVVLPDPEPRPLWLDRVYELNLPLQWVGGYVTDHEAELPSLDALAAQPALPASALASFRAFAAAQGAPVPDGPDADAHLQRILVRRVAAAKWGEAGYYRIDAVLDPAIKEAARALDAAAALVSSGS